MLYRVYATIPVLIDCCSENEEDIKRNVAKAIANHLPSAPTDYSIDFSVEPITCQSDIYDREKDIIPLFGYKKCKDATNFAKKPKRFEDIQLDLFEFTNIDIKEDFQDE